MQTNSQLRQTAREQLSGNWSSFLIVTIVYMVIMAALGSLQKVDYVGTLASLATIFVSGPLAIAYIMMMLKFVRTGEKPAVEGMFAAFNSTYYWKSVGLNLLVGIYTILWMLLLIVPGIIKAISYSMSTFILADNPELTCEQAVCRSMEMMNGHKMDYFLIALGLFGLTILSGLLLFIPMLWLIPYYQVVFTNFYLQLKEEQSGENA